MEIKYSTTQTVEAPENGSGMTVRYNSVIDQETYEGYDLAECRMPEDAAILMINRNFGFEASRIRVEDKAMAWEEKPDGTKEHRPGLWMYREAVWFDWDSCYIRFRVDDDGQLWELWDGELYQIAEEWDE